MFKIPNLTKVVKDIKLVTFFEEKNNKCQLVGAKELVSLANHYDKNLRYEHQLIQKLDDYFTEEHSRLYDILSREENKGKLSICGLSVNNIIRGSGDNNIDHFLYFHSCTVEEAYNILCYVVKKLKGEICHLKDINTIYVSSKGNTYYFQCCIYKDREEILRNIGNAPIQHGYDPVQGYFSTIPGLMSLFFNVAIIDKNYTYDEIQEYTSNGIILVSKDLETSPKCDDMDVHDEEPVYNYLGQFIYYEWRNVNENFERIVSTRLPDIFPVKFCSFNELPIILYPCFGERYLTTKVGISYEKYIVFWRLADELTKDIFRFICLLWLEVKVDAAKKRLLK